MQIVFNRPIEVVATAITEPKETVKVVSKNGRHQTVDNSQLRSHENESWRFGDIIGKSRCMHDVYELISSASSSDANVIVYGESGTGKELVANAVHRMSYRKAKQIVPVNCGAISEHLLESEFFGYKKGAFTGANNDKQGFLDLADNGTLFLDELGELNLNIQAKLLRAIDGGGYTPVGSTMAKKSNFRIIAATNRDLQSHVIKGLMRRDFFFRIHVIPIYLPPLRERKEDIPLLIDHFLSAYDYKNQVPVITGNTLEKLLNYSWPGNVRELENTLHRFATIGKLDFLREPMFQQVSRKDLALETIKKETLGLQEATAHFEKMYIHNVLEQNKWHRKNVASILKISRRTLYDKMKNYRIIEINQPSTNPT